MTVVCSPRTDQFGSRAVDDLQSYVIYDLTDDTLYYESLKTEIYFESHRIDCAKLSLRTPPRTFLSTPCRSDKARSTYL